MSKSENKKGTRPAGYDSFSNDIGYNTTQLQHGPDEEGFRNGTVVTIHPAFLQMCEAIRSYKEKGETLPEELFTTIKARGINAEKDRD